MRKIIIYAISAIFAVLVVINYGNAISSHVKRWIDFSFCDRPIKYKVAYIDPKFNITEDEVKLQSGKAADIWNKIVDKPLFEYADDGNLKISLIYDERQEILRSISMLDSEVGEKKEVLDTRSSEYEKQRASIEKELEELNKTIDYWNSKGGAPKDVYEKLVEQQRALKKKIDALNKIANSINSTVNQVNDEIHDLNNKVNDFNSVISVSPEMGLYTSGINTIDIYFFANKEELVHVLAHEMGHALGLAHLENENSIMNPITSANTTPTEEDKKAIIELCQNKNRLDLIKSDLENAVYTFRSWLYIKLQDINI